MLASARVLALDIAPTKTGYAHDGPDGAPIGGTWRVSERDKGCHGDHARAFQMWLRQLCGSIFAPGEIGILAFESPMVRAGGHHKGAPTNANTVIMQLGLTICAEVVASERSLVCHGGHIGMIRKTFTGTGRADKAMVQQQCRVLGWRFVDDNHADALCVWHWAKSAFVSSYRPHVVTPLLQGVS